MNTSTRPNKSTNVRFTPAMKAARMTLEFLGPRAPSLAARWAEEMFLTARRSPRPAKERAVLASAEATRVPYAGSHLPVWIWTPEAIDDPPTAILVHGWEGRGSQLGAFVEPLLARGIRVVAFDAPGHGDAPLRHASVVDHARALVAVAEDVASRGVLAVVGHSVGGAAALLATRFGLRPGRLALVAPPMSPARFAAGFSRMMGLDERVHAAMIHRLEERYGIAIPDLDVRRDAARFASPVLVVHDEDDRIVPPSDGAAIAGAAAHGELVATRGLGHGRILEAPLVVERVVGFVTAGARRPQYAKTFAETLEGELFVRDTRR
jgi:pimeloyl-ACP methyl ester carboxylesterase